MCRSFSGLILSGMSIYWASPVYQHPPNPNTGSFDVVADIGIWLCAHVPGLHDYSSPPDWVYNHMSLGPGMLAVAFRLHWLFAYLFMLNGLVYVLGLGLGGGWRALLPRTTDLRDALKMFGITSAFHSPNWRAVRGCIRPSTQSTTHCSASPTSPCRLSASFRWLRAGRFTNPCNCIGWLRFLAAMTRRASGIFGLCGSFSSSLCRM